MPPQGPPRPGPPIGTMGPPGMGANMQGNMGMPPMGARAPMMGGPPMMGPQGPGMPPGMMAGKFYYFHLIYKKFYSKRH